MTAIPSYPLSMPMRSADSPVIDVLVPARNSADIIADLVHKVPARQARSVVVVDYGSTDNTAQRARDAGAVVLRVPRGGYGEACQRGVRHLQALPVQPSLVGFVPGDGSYDPASLLKLVPVVTSGDAELVIGTRREGSGLSSRVAVRMISTIYRHKFEDFSPLRVIRFPALVALGLSDRGEAYNAEMQVKAVRFGLRILDVPVAHGRQQSRSLKQKAELSSRVLFHILRHSTAR